MPRVLIRGGFLDDPAAVGWLLGELARAVNERDAQLPALEPIAGAPSDHLRASLERIERARRALEPGVGPIERDVVVRELARAEMAVLRALHLLGG